MNSIEFWNCPSNTKWFHYTLVDKDTKKFNLSLIFSCKALWDLNKIRKKNVTTSLKNWQMTFQASNLKSNQFFELLDNEFHTIKLLYIKGDPWIRQFRYSNLLYVRATRNITNHTPIGEYYLRFFPERKLQLSV